jgi:DNA-binding helix-hairpin-helix protein with protein kinase domain
MNVTCKSLGSVRLVTPELFGGGEGEIFALDGHKDLAVKLYYDQPEHRAEKVAAMVEQHCGIDRVLRGRMAWPIDTVHAADASGGFLGFVMPLYSKRRPLRAVIDAKPTEPGGDFHFRERVALQLAMLGRDIHGNGVVIGDVNPGNFVVSDDGSVAAVDVDSFQVRGGGRTYRCEVGQFEYTAPELVGKRLSEFDRDWQHDSFAIAVLTFQLLMGGLHPFGANYSGPDRPLALEERIAAGLWPYRTGGVKHYAPRTDAAAWSSLPRELQCLYRRCFELGHDDPRYRPTLAELTDVLQQNQRRSPHVCLASLTHPTGANSAAVLANSPSGMTRRKRNMLSFAAALLLLASSPAAFYVNSLWDGAAAGDAAAEPDAVGGEGANGRPTPYLWRKIERELERATSESVFAAPAAY